MLEDTTQDRVALLRQQLAEAEQQKALLEKAEIAKAARLAIEAKEAAERRQAEKYAERERRLEEAKKKAAEMAEAETERKRQEKAEQYRLECDAEKLAEALRLREKQRAEEKTLEEKVHALEMDNKKRLEDLQRASQPLPEEQKPVTLSSPSHPLSRLFGNGAEVVTVQPREIDSVEQAKQNGVPATKSDTWRVIKHGLGNNFVNSATSYLLEKEIKKQTGIQANTQRLDHLSSLYDEADLMKALGLAVAAFREGPMSHDGFLGFVESLLLEAENAPA